MSFTTLVILTTYFIASEDVHLALSGTRHHIVQATMIVNGTASFVILTFPRDEQRTREV